MTMQENISVKDLEIIATISKAEKSHIFLCTLKESTDLLILKQYKGTGMVDFYRRLKMLECEYFPKVYACWEEQGATFLLEEYIAGETLEERLQKEQPLQEEELIGYLLGVCKSLIVLHCAEPPIIHRDLKPENIMINEEGSIKILDFDASREQKENQEHDTIMLGTREYASPEQYGFRQTDIRSDIYSFGIVFAELLQQAKVSSAFVTRSRRIITKATMFDPEKRYTDSKELLKDLEKLGKKNLLFLPVGMGILVVMVLLVSLGVKYREASRTEIEDAFGSEVVSGTEHTDEEVFLEENMEETSVPEDEKIEEIDASQNDHTEKADISQEDGADTIEESEEWVSYSTDFMEEIVEYNYVSIAAQIQERESKVFAAYPELYDFPRYGDNDDGMYTSRQECIIGTDYKTYRFIKEYPRDIYFGSYNMKGLEITNVQYRPYVEELGSSGFAVELSKEDYSYECDEFIRIHAEFLETLEPGAYTFTFKTEGKFVSMGYAFYLIVHDAGEKVDNFRMNLDKEMHFYLPEKQNSVLVMTNNCIYPIAKVILNGEALEPENYQLVNNGYGVMFTPEFLDKYKDQINIDMDIVTENDKKALVRIIYLNHFED